MEVSSLTANIHGISIRKLENRERGRSCGEIKHCSYGEMATPGHSSKPPGQWYQRNSEKL
ncbi:hypothetical protein ILUMI_14022, partial [Ignelater luminosus]